MIGVIPKADQMTVVGEFFQLFKTPWELHRHGRAYDVVVATADGVPEVDARLLIVYGPEIKSSDARDGIAVRSKHRGGFVRYRGIDLPIYGEFATFEDGSAGIPCITASSETAGLTIGRADSTVIRLGYDLFQEVRFLFSVGQPVERAHIPTLDVHIMMLRAWFVKGGITFLEIPPAPAGRSFMVCLTHDIDFAGIRNHRFDHSMFGFLYRSTVGSIGKFFRRRISFTRLCQMWRAAASLPFVYLGWAKDFWDPFEWYLRVEKNLPATYFFIPFKRRCGDRVSTPHASRRATAYDITDLPEWTATLMQEGCELGVHGIDAWHSVEKGRDELARIAAVTGESKIGIRIHWLLRGEDTLSVLEEAGYAYDSSVGYNETIGYRSGTTQTFRPLDTTALLELPLHIQDGALFFPRRLALSEPDAWIRCRALIDHVRECGGALTVLWHDRSHGPERFWGDFYLRLVQELKSLDGWFGTAGQVVGWFRKRREVRFDVIEAEDGAARIRLCYQGEEIRPPLNIRIHRPCAGRDEFVDIDWTGETVVEPDFWHQKGQSTCSLR